MQIENIETHAAAIIRLSALIDANPDAETAEAIEIETLAAAIEAYETVAHPIASL